MTNFIVGFALGAALWPLINLLGKAAYRVLTNALKEDT